MIPGQSLQAILLEGGLARAFAPQDALGVAALAARTRGLAYTTADGGRFDADRLAEAVRAGRARGAVVAGPDGRILAFAALEPRSPGALEVGARAVEAEGGARGPLAARLWTAAVAEARHAGARTLVVEEEPGAPLAPHDGPEAAAAAWIAFAGDGEARLARVFALERRALASRLPSRRAELFGRVLAAAGLARETAPPPAGRAPDRASLEVDIVAPRRLGRVRLRVLAPDAAAEVERLWLEMKRGKLHALEVRVPLESAEGAALVESLESRGFATAGLEPDVEGRDEAVLLRLCGARIDPRPAAPSSDGLARALAATLGEGLARGRETPAPVHPASAPAAPSLEEEPPPPPPAVPPIEMIEFARLAGQKQLVSGISHEINNPLNIILGTTYVLKSRLREGKTDDALARLAAIEEEVARVARVLEGLRRFAHPEASGRARVEVGACIDDAVALVAGEARAQGIELVREAAAGLPALRANRAEIAQVVFQLLRNAIEASAPGGSIALEASQAGEQARIAVRDRGRGIAPEDLRRVFDPFFTTKTGGVGAGLGLSIARAIVEAHGGRLRLESRPGEGTAAYVEVPLARERGASREQGQQHQQGSEARAR